MAEMDSFGARRRKGFSTPPDFVHQTRLSRFASLPPHPVFRDARVVDEQVHGCKSEHLAVDRLKQPAHVFPPYLETSPRYTSSHVVILALLVA